MSCARRACKAAPGAESRPSVVRRGFALTAALTFGAHPFNGIKVQTPGWKEQGPTPLYLNAHRNRRPMMRRQLVHDNDLSGRSGGGRPIRMLDRGPPRSRRTGPWVPFVVVRRSTSGCVRDSRKYGPGLTQNGEQVRTPTSLPCEDHARSGRPACSARVTSGAESWRNGSLRSSIRSHAASVFLRVMWCLRNTRSTL